jgi:hypothetical protein
MIEIHQRWMQPKRAAETLERGRGLRRSRGFGRRRRVDTEVNLLGEPKVPDAARLLAGAFAADPVLGYYLTGGWRQRLAFRAFFRAALHESLPHGAVHAARSGSDLVGVAAWLPPDPPETPPNRHARRSTATVRTLYPRTGGELFAGFAGLEALHPSEPHWYLMFVGVEPSLQSSGVGAELLLDHDSISASAAGDIDVTSKPPISRPPG